MITSEHIQESIDNALLGISNLEQDRLAVRGFSTPTIRHLFNNLCNIDGKYLEIGLFCGATFCSSFNHNCTAIGIEDHSQDFSEGFDKVKQELKENVEKFSGIPKDVKVHYADCYNMDKSLLPDGFDIYFYDGWHSEEMQAKALPEFLDKMADKFIWVDDDYHWDYVASGTTMGIEQLKDKIQIEKKWLLSGQQVLNDSVWHNGLIILLINKK